MSFWTETKPCDLSEYTPDYSENLLGIIKIEKDPEGFEYILIDGHNLNTGNLRQLSIRRQSLTPVSRKKSNLSVEGLKLEEGKVIYLSCYPEDATKRILKRL